MEFYKFYGGSEDSAICLGDFDGLHKGHRRVFSKAGKTGEWGVFLFSHNSKDEKEILTLPEKLSMLKELGAKYVVAADFKEEIRDKSCGEFLDILDSLKVKTAAVGYDYRFGKGAAGDARLLEELCRKRNINVLVADAVTDGGEPIKSTKIRELLENGKVDEANRLLGELYIVSGVVEKGFGNGKLLGFPTANIGVSEYKLLPKDGVYKGKINGKDAVINIGKNPTFGANRRTVEAHIIDEDINLYESFVTAQIVKRIRGEIKFGKKEDLILQIQRDIESIKGEN